MTTPTLKTKLFGTAAFVILALGVSFTGFSLVQAQFVATNQNLKVDGIVNNVDVTNRMVTLNTVSSKPLAFQIDDNTVFGAYYHFHDIKVGDHLTISASRDSGVYVANVVKKDDGTGPGYGTEGEVVLVQRGTVLNKNSDNNGLLVLVGHTQVRFQVALLTDFKGKSYSDLQVGDQVEVHGRDTGNTFFASQVIFKGHGNSQSTENN